ncbi:hypothetical protein MMC07_007371 [Pseudocyphellaria aurata]|nr:hypothetical protein [Pseudocyphellaria aurata]
MTEQVPNTIGPSGEGHTATWTASEDGYFGDEGDTATLTASEDGYSGDEGDTATLTVSEDGYSGDEGDTATLTASGDGYSGDEGDTATLTASGDGYSGDESAVDSSPPETAAVGSSTPTHQARGLLDLPPDVRTRIFRHLLVDPDGVDLGLWATRPRPRTEILRTSRLIYAEAFAVLYGENDFLYFPGSRLTWSPHIVDAIQNVRVDVPLGLLEQATRHFRHQAHLFGSRGIARGTLTVEFLVDGPGRSARPLVDWFVPLRWFVAALGRFVNFRTVQLHVLRAGVRNSARSLRMLTYLEAALEPVLGLAEEGSREEKGVRFHPLDHWRLWKEFTDGDWADFLDRIRGERSEDADSYENVQPGSGEP